MFLHFGPNSWAALEVNNMKAAVICQEHHCVCVCVCVCVCYFVDQS